MTLLRYTDNSSLKSSTSLIFYLENCAASLGGGHDEASLQLGEKELVVEDWQSDWIELSAAFRERKMWRHLAVLHHNKPIHQDDVLKQFHLAQVFPINISFPFHVELWQRALMDLTVRMRVFLNIEKELNEKGIGEGGRRKN